MGATATEELRLPAGDGHPVHGRCAPGWREVALAFAEGFSRREEVGAALAVHHHGQVAVELGGGAASRDGTQRYEPDTPQLVFSATKGMAAVCIGLLVAERRLDLDAPVARYWPEFAAAGKHAIPVRWLLAHRAGLPALDRRLTLADVLHGREPVLALAAQAPLWPPGRKHGYHAVTFGWLAGELLRRVSGISLGAFFAREVAEPLRLRAWIGLPAGSGVRPSPLLDPPPLRLSERLMLGLAKSRRSLLWRSLTLDGTLETESTAALFNRADLHAAELPSSNGITDARSLARLWAATLGPLEDAPAIWDEPTRLAMTAQQVSGFDRCLLGRSRYAVGLQLHSPLSPLTGAAAYGHYGIGGSLGLADPELDLALGYTTNRISANAPKDARVVRILAAVRAAGKRAAAAHRDGVDRADVPLPRACARLARHRRRTAHSFPDETIEGESEPRDGRRPVTKGRVPSSRSLASATSGRLDASSGC